MGFKAFVHNHPKLALIVFSLIAALSIAFLDQSFLVLGNYFYSFHPFLRFLYQYMPNEWNTVQSILSETMFWFVLIATVITTAKVSRRYSFKGLISVSIIFSFLFTLSTLSVVSQIFLASHGPPYVYVAMGMPHHFLTFYEGGFSNLFLSPFGNYHLSYVLMFYDLATWFCFYLCIALVARYIPIEITLRNEPPKPKTDTHHIYVEEDM